MDFIYHHIDSSRTFREPLKSRMSWDFKFSEGSYFMHVMISYVAMKESCID